MFINVLPTFVVDDDDDPMSKNISDSKIINEIPHLYNLVTVDEHIINLREIPTQERYECSLPKRIDEFK